MSMIPHNTLVVVADGRAARLFRNVGDESGLKLHQETTLDASDAANDGPAGSQPQDSDTGEAAFAKVLAHKVNQMALQHAFDHVVLVADPTTLGELRPQLHKEVVQRTMAEVAKDWTNTPLEQISSALQALRIG